MPMHANWKRPILIARRAYIAIHDYGKMEYRLHDYWFRDDNIFTYKGKEQMMTKWGGNKIDKIITNF
jgi:hypothetical protein